ncbi:MAG TPA: hypothetical protein VHW09_18525 [Bryobacteraceae bacterium]|jgi:hypothetical protein|nr:hypothetical protein [Bryobacteraceae bacterium]
MDDIPFDLRALRIIIYEKNAPEWGELLRSKIQSSIAEVLQAPSAAVLPTFLEVKAGSEKAEVTVKERDLIEIRQELDLVKRELRTRDTLREPTSPARALSPGEAELRIREMVKRGMPDAIIVDELMPLGPPPSWIMERIREAQQSSKIVVGGRSTAKNVPKTVKVPNKRAKRVTKRA